MQEITSEVWASLRRTSLSFVLFALCVLPTLAVAFLPVVKASPSNGAFDVKVDRLVQIRDSGPMTINDTVTLQAKSGQSTAPISNYTLGLPFGSQSNLDYAFAYNSSGYPLKLQLDASMGRLGFYGVNVVFQQPLNITALGSYRFTVVFVFSNSIAVQVSQVGSTPIIMYNASFPAYPSLAQTALNASLTVVFPASFNYTQSSFQNEGVNFTITTAGSEKYFKVHPEANLTEFSNQTEWFAVSKEGSTAELLDAPELDRSIQLLSTEQITVSDQYRIVNEGDNLTQTEIKLPREAFDISAYDEFGPVSSTNLKIEQGNVNTNVTITFTPPYNKSEEARFSVQYELPWKNHVSDGGMGDFHVSLSFSSTFNWTIRQLTTTVILPEGATILSYPTSIGLSSLQNSAFSSSLTYVYQNFTIFHDQSLDFSYKRVVFWDSFRPTVWVGAFVILAAAIVGVFRVYRPAPAPLPTAIISIRAEDLKSFVDSYDEKRRLTREVDSLETQARKGRIPRRRYKVRKMTVEGRLASLSRDLTALREKIRMAGPRYADLMRQIEVAETELQGVEADLARTEVRYRRGEISAAAYHKLLEDSYRRRDRAQTTIDGALLRLREEIT